jgi:hypothetical protein
VPWITVDGAHILIGEPGQEGTRAEQIKAALASKRGGAKVEEGKPKDKPRKLTTSEKADRLKKGKPLTGLSEKAKRAQASQAKTDGEVQTYTKANEDRLAQRLGGKSYPDNGPTDVESQIGNKTRGTELKTLVHGKNDKVTMKKDALARKYAWEKENHSKMETVILDHRDRFAGGKNAAHYSGHEIYYKRGLGSLRISSMHKVKDDAELKQLQATPYHKLPAAAQGTMVGHEKGFL